MVVKSSKRITLSFGVESRCDEIKLAAPEAQVLMGMKVEELSVLEATRSVCMQGNANVVSVELLTTEATWSMQGGDANVVSIKLQAAEAAWSIQGGDANVVVVQIHGGHGLRRAVGQELCHGGRSRAITFSTSTTRAAKSA